MRIMSALALHVDLGMILFNTCGNKNSKYSDDGDCVGGGLESPLDNSGTSSDDSCEGSITEARSALCSET